MDFFGGIVDSIKDTVTSVDDFFGVPISKGIGQAGKGLLAADKAKADAAKGEGNQIARMSVESWKDGNLSRELPIEGSEDYRRTESEWTERLNKFRRIVEETKQSVK